MVSGISVSISQWKVEQAGREAQGIQELTVENHLSSLFASSQRLLVSHTIYS